MHDDIAIKVENLSKVFTLRQPQIDEHGNTTSEHWALKDVSFEIKKGESVGIIGPNGSGKSTLLKILAGVTKPTSGTVKIRGKVASILDIGAGFHPELSGRDNVFLNGQVHGFTKKEIASKFDEIVAFSGIEKFIDEPVKNYSNGMYLRLAFSIMANLDFDIYLLDEVFSVGDAEFGLKTQKKFQELASSKRTMIFVSHNIQELEHNNSYIHIEKGALKQIGVNRKLLSNYVEKTLELNDIEIYDKNVKITNFSSFPQVTNLAIKSVEFHQAGDSLFTTDKSFFLDILYEKKDNCDTIDIVIEITDIDGKVLLSSTSYSSTDFNLSTDIQSGDYHYSCTIPAPMFNIQIYRLNIYLIKNLKLTIDAVAQENKKIGTMALVPNIEFSAILPHLITFKCCYYNQENTVFDLSELNKGLLPGFEWDKKKIYENSK